MSPSTSQQPAQMMMVSNGMTNPPTTILMPSNPYTFPQYVVNSAGQPGVMQWPMQPQQSLPAYITPGANPTGMPNAQDATPDRKAAETAPGTTNEDSDKQSQQQQQQHQEQAPPGNGEEKSGDSANGEQQGNPTAKTPEVSPVKEASQPNDPKAGSETPNTVDPSIKDVGKDKKEDAGDGNGNDKEPKKSEDVSSMNV